MYLQSAARSGRLVSIEGAPALAAIARLNLELLGFKKQAMILEGAFDQRLPDALGLLEHLDLVYLDGHHLKSPTLSYFEKCLVYAHAQTVLVFDDIYWSPEMKSTWQIIKNDPRITLTVDFFDLSVAFINPDFKQKQHFKVVPFRWKCWMVW
jgi:predicted O-methyltransferase YrrM